MVKMWRILVVGVIAWLVGALALSGRSLTVAAALQAAPAQRTAAATSALQPTELVTKYCMTCHNERVKSGQLVLNPADLSDVPAHSTTWERVARKLRAGMMPPQGSPRPDETTLKAFVAHIEGLLDRGAEARPYAGRVGVHRLNRTEYENAVRDLLDLDIDAALLLPPDSLSYGFDNMAESLVVTPSLLEKYLSAAQRVSRLAMNAQTRPVAQMFRVRTDLSQDRHIEGLPLGTRGGLVVTVNFQATGEYLFQPTLWRTQTDILRGMDTPSEVEILLDSVRVHSAKVGGKEDDKVVFETRAESEVQRAIDRRLEARVRVTAGPHTVGVTFLNKSEAPRVTLMRPFLKEKHDNQNPAGIPELKQVTVTGPFNPDSEGEDTPSRRRVMVCRPASDALPCARQIVTQLARRAYRRPPSSRETDAAMRFYSAARAQGKDFDAGIQAVLTYLLASPEFLFRTDNAPEKLAPGSVYPIDDLALASRLSFFLWRSIPDDQLIDLAAAGRLRRPGVLTQQLKRLLDDERSDRFVKDFAGQWLNLRSLQAFNPSPVEFTDFDGNLRELLGRETELFIKSIIREDRSLFDLLTADYTFMNERLARHYGVKGVYGEAFRRVSLADQPDRRGLLGQASILTVTSFSTRTSPVVRGQFVLSRLLGIPAPEPPPNVPSLPDRPAGAVLSMRDRMAAHRSNAVCSSCHKLMDPIGLSLENFDGIGRWRSDDHGAAIDASGQLADGQPVNGVSELRDALVKRGDLFVSNFVVNLLTYATGRGLNARDLPTVRAIVQEAAQQDYRFSAIVRGVAMSAPFSMSTKEAAPDAAPPTAAVERSDARRSAGL